MYIYSIPYCRISDKRKKVSTISLFKASLMYGLSLTVCMYNRLDTMVWAGGNPWILSQGKTFSRMESKILSGTDLSKHFHAMKQFVRVFYIYVNISASK